MTDPHKAVRGVDAVYTDAWTSMGHEHETEERNRIFPPYQVNENLMSGIASHGVFMHCLPAHRNEEVTDSVIDSARSVVFDQAENRMHVQKAILLMLVGGNDRLPFRSAHA
jgi:ornithine carbamoyltransferase